MIGRVVGPSVSGHRVDAHAGGWCFGEGEAAVACGAAGVGDEDGKASVAAFLEGAAVCFGKGQVRSGDEGLVATVGGADRVAGSDAVGVNRVRCEAS